MNLTPREAETKKESKNKKKKRNYVSVGKWTKSKKKNRTLPRKYNF